ncbi:hypothetical protein [Methanococcus voltae]|uniref:GxxExxY protein n=1 Tax=Methanococcus voltae (strain ATCC BAA-1334 / A3) TaxID=456320 RepID=D7DSR3_METV3|nr:hypothetical protein [Methanococcus voltae]MCS3901774.1 hypothetical protein [Methanococcus voltae]
MYGYYDKVYREIRNWKPSKRYKSEKGYQEDLFKHLKKNLNNGPFTLGNTSVRMEAGRNLCDIVVEKNIGIELKKDLTTKAKVDRLLGQVNRYLEEYQEGVIIVLVGNTSESKLEDLKYALRPLTTSGYGFPKSLKVVAVRN